MMLSKHVTRSALAATILVSLAACSELPKRDPAKAGPFFTPTNVTTLGRMPMEVRRVVVLPVATEIPESEDTYQRLDREILAALTQSGRFETVSASREEFRRLTGKPALKSTDVLPPDLFARLKEKYGADAVLFTDVTRFSPYPPLAVGIRVKLTRVNDRQIVWAADNVFSASDPAVANSARRHALELGADRGPGDLSHTVLQNPSRFVAYAAAETFKTIPAP